MPDSTSLNLMQTRIIFLWIVRSLFNSITKFGIVLYLSPSTCSYIVYKQRLTTVSKPIPVVITVFTNSCFILNYYLGESPDASYLALVSLLDSRLGYCL